MYLQEILEVVIGLIFMWLIMSLAAMTLQEWIANMLNWRARDLERAIRGMLGDSTLAKQIYTHPVVYSLYRKITRRKARIPSYIPASKFAMALFDITIRAGTESSPIVKIFSNIHDEMENLESPEQRKLAIEDWDAISATARQIASSTVAQTAIDSLKAHIQNFGEKYPELQEVIDKTIPHVEAYYQYLINEQRSAEAGGQVQDLTLRQIRLGILAMDTASPEFKVTMTTFLRDAEMFVKQGEQAIAVARTNVENWFNDTMDRLSGAYKRKSQVVAFLIGVFLALFMNVDSINIATNLWREPTLRQAIVASAENYVVANEQTGIQTEAVNVNLSDTFSDLQDQLRILSLPFGWVTAPFYTGEMQCAVIPISANQISGIPSIDGDGNPICKRISNFPIDLTGWLSKIVGIFITGVATAQGAPFWFDILKKLVNVRSTGTNPSEKK